MKKEQPTFDDFLNLTIEEFYKKHDQKGYSNAVDNLSKKMTDSADVKEKIERKIKSFNSKNLSPSIGAYICFVVQDDQKQDPEIVLMTFDDARGRGKRLNINGTAEKGIDTCPKNTLLREVKEEFLNNPSLMYLVENIQGCDLEKLPIHETNKWGLDRLQQLKFLYYSKQYIWVDTSRIYTTDQLEKMTSDADQAAKKIHSIAQPLIDLRFYNAKKDPEMKKLKKLSEKVNESIQALNNWYESDKEDNVPTFPLLEKQREALQKITDLIDTDIKSVQTIIEDNFMPYVEAKGFGFIPWSELKNHPQVTDIKTKGNLFEPNAEAMNDLITTRGEKLAEAFKLAIWKATKTGDEKVDVKNIKSLGDSSITTKTLDTGATFNINASF